MKIGNLNFILAPIRGWHTRVVLSCEQEDNYRFGFNTQEKVNEISGKGNHTTALFWECVYLPVWRSVVINVKRRLLRSFYREEHSPARRSAPFTVWPKEIEARPFA